MSEKEKQIKASRAWEIDMARGTAVMLMTAFHAVFDLTVFYDAGINYLSGFWFYVGRLSALMFIFISGISSSFSRSLFKRGLVVLGCALTVTVASIPIMGENYIRFGILHFFGTVMILKGAFDYLVKDARLRNVAAAVLIPVSYVLGRVVPQIRINTPLLLPLGIMPSGFSSYDYYPLFPWLAVFSAGVLTASALYRNRRSLFAYDPIEKNNPVVKAVCFFGRHSLAVYLLHQPVIMAVLYIMFNASKILSW